MPLMILSLNGLNYTILYIYLANRPFKLDMIDLDYKIGLARYIQDLKI